MGASDPRRASANSSDAWATTPTRTRCCARSAPRSPPASRPRSNAPAPRRRPTRSRSSARSASPPSASRCATRLTSASCTCPVEIVEVVPAHRRSLRRALARRVPGEDPPADRGAARVRVPRDLGIQLMASSSSSRAPEERTGRHLHSPRSVQASSRRLTRSICVCLSRCSHASRCPPGRWPGVVHRAPRRPRRGTRGAAAPGSPVSRGSRSQACRGGSG